MGMYSWIDIAPHPVLGAAMGLIVLAVLLVAGAAKLAGMLHTEHRLLAADAQADIRDRMNILKTLGVSPGVRYHLALQEGLVPETKLERLWVAEMLKPRAQLSAGAGRGVEVRKAAAN